MSPSSVGVGGTTDQRKRQEKIKLCRKCKVFIHYCSQLISLILDTSHGPVIQSSKDALLFQTCTTLLQKHCYYGH